MAVFTNQKASQALNGQAVVVTVADGEIAAMQDVEEGQLATAQSGATGTVYRVDYKGNSFKVMPIQPNTAFGVYGYLAVGQTVTI
jgi:hypothetical protein